MLSFAFSFIIPKKKRFCNPAFFPNRTNAANYYIT